MSRFLLIINCKTSNLFYKEFIFKCLTMILLGEFSFVTFSPILVFLNSSGAGNEGDFRMASA